MASSSTPSGSSASAPKITLKTPSSAATPTAVPKNHLANATLANFPTGPSSRRDLRRSLVSSTDPASTITSYGQTHSLHSSLARAFDTTPAHELRSTKVSGGRTSRSSVLAKNAEDREGIVVEPFQPEPVLKFLGHLGVRRYEVHRAVSDALRLELENEIGRTDPGTTVGFEALLRLLKSVWSFATAVPELRPVLVTLIKKLGAKTPPPVLQRLAERDSKTGEPKHSELLNQFGVKMRRLVWEADWSRARNDPDSSIDLYGKGNVLIDLIRPAVLEYGKDELWRKHADLVFVETVRERRVATNARRTATSKAGGKDGANVRNSAATKSGAATEKEEQKEEEKPLAGNAISKIREVIGDRPRLLGAVLSVLVSEHGRSLNDAAAEKAATLPPPPPSSEYTLLGGSQYLNCCLVSDVLLTYGQLPRQYEHVGILARVLDDAAKTGLLTDDAVAQVQGCLRAIFQQGGGGSDSDKKSAAVGADGNVLAGVKKEEDDDASSKASSVKSKSDSAASASKKKTSDKEYALKLIKRVLTAAVSAMKQSDPQGLFLNPVTDAIAPGYSSVIKEPMCICMIEDKITKLQYTSLTQYEKDVKLMFQNCITYNIGKEGTWFRGEARRQMKVWKEDILSQAKVLLRNETAKRKRQLEKADAEAGKEEKRKKREAVIAAEKIAKAEKAARAAEAERKKNLAAAKPSSASNGNDDNAINRLGALDVKPLPPSRAKRRKKDSEGPSVPCLASMMLSDPFVVRLLLDRILRSIRTDVLRGKALPTGHRVVPSVLQILHLAGTSTSLCASGGRRYVMPPPGLIKPPKPEDGEHMEDDRPFAALRRCSPLLGRLLLDSDLDRRIAPGGDLHSVASSPEGLDPPRMPMSEEEWIKALGSESEGSNSLPAVRALVEGSLVRLLQPGNSTDAALLTQLPRFGEALAGLTNRGNGGQVMSSERPFYVSLAQAILRHKSKLTHPCRDVITLMWMKWFGREGGLDSPAHECFIMLLNEWASLGNLVLPRDKLLSLSEDAAKMAENGESDPSRKFAILWLLCNDDEGGNDKHKATNFGAVKAQYVRMLNGVQEERAANWKENVGIDEASLKSLSERIAKEERKRKRREEKSSGRSSEGPSDMKSERKRTKIKISDRK